MDKELASAAQESWQDIALLVRLQLAKQVPFMPAMGPSELSSFIEALNAAMWLEVKAANFDAEVDEMKATLLRSTLYGG